jgi:hypothetical protein
MTARLPHTKEDEKMSGLIKFAMILRLSLIALVALPLTLGIASSSAAATADIVSFNAYRHTGPPPLLITTNKIDFTYTATWSGSDRKCLRTIDWYEDNALVLPLSNVQSYSSPASASGTITDAPRSEGDGDYYKILIEIRDVNSPYALYAYDSETDGSF